MLLLNDVHFHLTFIGSLQLSDALYKSPFFLRRCKTSVWRWPNAVVHAALFQSLVFFSIGCAYQLTNIPCDMLRFSAL